MPQHRSGFALLVLYAVRREAAYAVGQVHDRMILFDFDG